MERIAQRSILGLCLAACVCGSWTRAAAHAQATPPPPASGPADATRCGSARRERAGRTTFGPTGAPAPAPGAAAPARGPAPCISGLSEGIPPGDAHTAAALVCEGLRNAGADVATEPVDPQAASGDSAYRIDVRPLGSLVILQVSFESPIGTTVDSRSLQLNGIEEVSVAAPRIADSLVHGTPLGKTAKIDTLVGQETRVYTKQYGETLFAFGVLGYALPDKTWGGYGVFGRLYYEAQRYAVGLDLRLGTSGNSDGDSSLVGLSVGARYFLSGDDISPFVGGGAGILWLGQKHRYGDETPANSYAYDSYDDRTQLRGSGLAAFGEVGCEFLRMHRSRLDASVRADAPFFDLEGRGHHRYTMPVSLQLSYSFD